MKLKIGISLVCCLFLCSGAGFSENSNPKTTARKGLLVSLIQDVPVLSSREEITCLVDFSRKSKVQVLFVQIYRSGQAWFPSQVADATPYKTVFQNIQEDPFALLIREAHQAGLEVHAWLNMLSLSVNETAPLLQKYGNDILTRDRNDKKNLSDYKIDSQYFLEPGDPRVRETLTRIVREILENYPDLDGIQFDYIRYPDTHPVYGYAPENLKRFQRETGISDVKEENPLWTEWKRRQVTELLRILARQARAIRPGILVSATGCMPYARAYHEAFQDWSSWIERGLVDFVTAMNYSSRPEEYARRNEVIKRKIQQFQKVYLAVGAYKQDSAADAVEKEFRSCEQSGAGGCIMFHYGSLLNNPSLVPVLSREFKSPFMSVLSTLPLASVAVKTPLRDNAVSNKNSSSK